MSIGLILFLIFMVLKLTHFIDWSWWYVCLPIIIEFVLWFLVVIAGGLGMKSTSGKVRSYGRSVSRR